MTNKEKIKFYQDVKKVVTSEGWKSEGELNESVQAFLADENWKKLVADYDAITQKISSLENVEIPIVNLSSDLSLTDLKD